MEFPPDKETMRSFLGMINYLNNILHSMHTSLHLSVHSHTRPQTTSQVKCILKTSID